MNKILNKLIIYLFLVVALLALSFGFYLKISVGSFKSYEPIKIEEAILGKATVNTGIEEMAVSEALKINKVFAYEGSHYFTYNPDDSPEMVKHQHGDNFIKRNAKRASQAFVKKEYTVYMSSDYMIGYDFSEVTKDDLSFEDDTLYLTLDKLEIVYSPDLSETSVESTTGMFRKQYTDQETKKIYEEVESFGLRVLTTDTFIKSQAIMYIEDSISEILSSSLDEEINVVVRSVGDYNIKQ